MVCVHNIFVKPFVCIPFKGFLLNNISFILPQNPLILYLKGYKSAIFPQLSATIMRAKIRLDGRKNVETNKGFPIIIYVTKNKKEKLIRTGYFSKLKDWDKINALPKHTHPNYIDLINYLDQKKIQIQKLLVDSKLSFIPLHEAEKVLSAKSTGLFYKDGIEYVKKSNHRIYSIALNSFQKYFPDYPYESINNTIVKSYMNSLLVTPTLNGKKKRSPNGVYSYMDALTALWNKLDKPNNPFSGIRPKEIKTKSKALTKEDLIKIRDNNYVAHTNSNAGGIKNYLNYIMLCFYLGGIDLVDLKEGRYDNNVVNDRFEFNRNKGGTDVFISNKIFPEAKEILKQYDCYPYLVPLYQLKNYNGFIPNMSRSFEKIKERLGLTKKPYSKAARYSFITRAQNLLIDERITIEIVGHSQSSTHSIYKDEFPYHVRDEAHKKIINLK